MPLPQFTYLARYLHHPVGADAPGGPLSVSHHPVGEGLAPPAVSHPGTSLPYDRADRFSRKSLPVCNSDAGPSGTPAPTNADDGTSGTPAPTNVDNGPSGTPAPTENRRYNTGRRGSSSLRTKKVPERKLSGTFYRFLVRLRPCGPCRCGG